MATAGVRRRCRERLIRLGDANLDSTSLRREVIAELKIAIGFDRWCAPLVDPETRIAHTGIGETDHLADMPLLQQHDASVGEPNSGAALSAGHDRVGILSTVTRGDLARSRRWRESLERHGTGDELRVLAADQRGCWGRFDVWRDKGDRPFSADDAQFLREVSSALGRAVRRTTVGDREKPSSVPPPAGVLVIDANLQAHRTTPATKEWFRLLNPAAVPYLNGIPSLVWTIVGRLLAAERGENPDRAPRIRVRAGDGCWAVVEAARLGGDRDPIAVSVHSAGAEEVLDLLARAHGLTVREGELLRLIVDGLDTPAIAARLVISRYTVQDHLKAIFRKIGVNSRLGLLTGLLSQVR
jgi:DNA-binding CsgD family transcriptional regulator